MKKIMSFLLCLTLVLTSIGASAGVEIAKDMENVLVAVKQNLDIPEELTEFSGEMRTYNKVEQYDFSWTVKDGSRSLNVSCDNQGRILSYGYYNGYSTQKKVPTVAKQQIIDFAHSFMQKTLPQCFADANDTLVYDSESYSAHDGQRYRLTFVRRKNGIEVKDNRASVTLAVKDDEIYATSMEAYIDYETTFNISADGSFDYVDTYKKEFPAEMIYRDEYSYYRKDRDNSKTFMVYRLKDDVTGFISCETGVSIQEDPSTTGYRYANAMTADTAAGGGSSNKAMLTEQELAELNAVEQLISEQDIREIIDKLPYVNFDSSYLLGNFTLYKDAYDKFFYTVDYKKESDTESNRYIYATVNADDGKVKQLSQTGAYYDIGNKQMSDEQKQQADHKVDEFLQAIAPEETAQCEIESASYNGFDVYRNYVRIVNGIKYINNGITVRFDEFNNEIYRYSLNFTDKVFASPSDAISSDQAYSIILENAPIKQLYIKSNGVFVKCYTLSSTGIELDAVSGKVNKGVDKKLIFEYTDMDNHWAKTAVNKLAEMQIGIDGAEFMPDNAITQYELVSLLCAGCLGNYNLGYSKDEFYEMEYVKNLLHDMELAPDALVTREDAFVIFIRIQGLEKVARLKDIYKVDYADGNLIAPDKIGYAAILSGMGIISGNGGYVRPADNITRAETAVMLYKYLLTF